MIIGIDAGGSAIKFAGLEDESIVFTRYYENKSRAASETVREILDEYGGDVKKLRVTGVNARKCGLENIKLPIETIPEPLAIGKGGVFLSGREDAVIASIGTGTAFVLARGGVFTHLGGTGLGGGTLAGLGARILGITDVREIEALSADGNVGAVDITIGELFSGSATLQPHLTAANLAKTDSGAGSADWAAGMINLVLQAAGTMAMLSAKGFGAKSVVITGAMASLSLATEIFRHFEDCYGIEYVTAAMPECSTATGAAIYGQIDI